MEVLQRRRRIARWEKGRKEGGRRGREEAGWPVAGGGGGLGEWLAGMATGGVQLKVFSNIIVDYLDSMQI